MAIRVRCSHCGHVFRVPDKYEGRQGKCPGCGDVTRLLNADRMPPVGPPVPGGDASNVISEQRTIVDRSDATERRTGAGMRTATPLDQEAELAENGMTPLFDRTSTGDSTTGASSSNSVSDASVGVGPVSSPAIGAESPFPGIAVEGANTDARPTTSRASAADSRKSSPVLLFAALAAVGGLVLLLLLGVGAYGVYAMFSAGDGVDNAVAPRATDGAPAPRVEPKQGTDAGPPPPAKPNEDGSADPPAEFLAQARKFTVRLRVARPQGDTTATGFFVDDQGWIATSWERVHGATSVHVQFDGDSSSLAAAGIVVEDRHSGLVLISAKPSRPFNVAPLETAVEVPPHAQLSSCAMPAWGDHWLNSCTVIRECATGTLPPAVLRQAGSIVGDGAGTSWIETQGAIAPDGAGGPLLDAAGKVVGMCLIADQTQQRAYSVHVSSLLALLEATRAASDPLQPFASDEPPPQFIPATPPPVANTPPLKPETPATGDKASALGERLASLHEQCSALDWMPRTAEQYAVFQQFALEAGAVAELADDARLPADQRRVLQESLAKALFVNLDWSDADGRQAVNELASQALDADQGQGVYAFGEVTYPVGRIAINSRPTVGLQSEGSRDALFFTIRSGSEELRGGTRWLIIGEYLGRIPALSGDPSAPDARRASLIHVKHLIGEPVDSKTQDADPLPPLK